LLGALIVAMLLVLPGASAHAVPSASEPRSGALLPEPPSDVVVTFTEPVYEQGTWIEVRDQDFARVDNDDLHITFGPRPVLRVTLPPLPDGAYRIVWQTYSQTDGHTVRGIIGFAVGDFAPPATETEGTQGAGVTASLARIVLYAGYALAIGAFAWQVFIRRRVPDGAHGLDDAVLDRAKIAAALAATAGLMLLAWETQRQTGLSFATFIASDGGAELVQRAAWAAGLLALTALWSRIRIRRRWPDLVLFAGWSWLVWLGAHVGHASVEGGAAPVVQFVHALSIAAWIGALPLLWLALRRATPADAILVGRRFGTLAMTAVILLAGSGVTLTLLILGRDVFAARPWWSAWGGLLAAKVAVAGAMVAAASVNRVVFLAADGDGGSLGAALRRLAARRGWTPLAAGAPKRPFARMVGREAGLGAVVLVLAGLLMSQAAPTYGLAAAEPDLVTDAAGDAFRARVHMSPHPTAGAPHLLRTYLTDAASMEPVTNNTCGRDDCIQVTWWPSGRPDEAAAPVALAPEGDGWWRAEGVLLAASGPHTFELRVQTGDVFLDALRFDADVATTP
jgi:copper transport protein